MWFAFWGDDVVGSTFIATNKWYHMALVYDMTLARKTIYLDGVLEAQSPSSPLAVSSSCLTFGCLTVNNTLSYGAYFNGYMDSVIYNSRVKNASEILDDATLVGYYRFQPGAPTADSGPNGINGIMTGGAMSVVGMSNYAMNFPTNGAYFQITGLVLMGTTNHAYSLSLWVKITSVNGGRNYCASIE